MSYTDCIDLESKVASFVLPYLKLNSVDGQVVVVNKGSLSVELQREYGDFFRNRKDDGSIVSVELKAERVYTGNVFLETWSNKTFGRQTTGWMVHLKSDIIMFYFYDKDILIVVDFNKLWNWCWIENHIFNYPEVPQLKHFQLNRTFGRIVPIEVLQSSRLIIRKVMDFRLIYDKLAA